MPIVQDMHNIKILKKILLEAYKQDLGFFIKDLNFKKYLSFNQKLQKSKFEESHLSPKNLKELLKNLNGTYLALGIFLNNRQDLIPEEFLKELKTLESKERALKFLHVKKIIRREFNLPLSNLFRKIERHPFYSDFLEQKHLAKLNSGEDVIIKVKRLDNLIDLKKDIEVMKALAETLDNKYSTNTLKIINEFERFTDKKLNYLEEAENLKESFELFSTSDYVFSSKLYPELISKNVLVIQNTGGEDLTKVNNFKKYSSKKEEIANNLTKYYLKLLTEKDLVLNLDLRNIQLLKNNVISPKECQSLLRLDHQQVEKVENLLINLRNPNAEKLAQLLKGDSKVDYEELLSEVSYLISNHYGSTLTHIEIKPFILDLIKLKEKHNLLSEEFVLTLSSIINLEDSCKQIYPDYSFMESSNEIIGKMVETREHHDYAINTFRKGLIEFKEVMKRIPHDLRKSSQGNIPNQEIVSISKEIKIANKHTVSALIIAALILGSALILLAELPPFYFNLPILSILFILGAIVLGIFLLISIKNEE